MRKLIFTLALMGAFFAMSYAQLPAFPGAYGFGQFATGARASSSPTVYRVTNLNDSGSGSFRDAVSSSNRIVVFDVAGVIRISSRIVVSSNIYIAGQTAPGEGITIYGNGFSFSGAHNTICRYLRIRMGNVGDSGKDALGIANGRNMIFDHVSVAWGRDETFSISGEDCINITIQNSIISQGLMAHSAGGLIQTNGGVTLYRNLYIDNSTRNNKIKGVNQYVNNIVYNWESGAYIMGGDSEGHSYANAVSNYFIKGPAKGGSPFSGANEKYHLFAEDNWHDGNRNGVLDGYLIPKSEYSGGPDFQSVPYNYPAVPTWPAVQLIDSLLPTVGASLPYRDLADYYVLNELKSFGKKGKLITNENELPIGVPTAWSVWAGSKRTDSDNDGIPDVWEIANGLNPNQASDAVQKAANGYLNIENYINSITADWSQDFLRAPLCLVADSATQNVVHVSWFDFTEKEDGYSVERKVGGVYTEIARLGKNISSFSLQGLQPEEMCTLRVRAYNAGTYSGYSNELVVKSKPVPVATLDLLTYLPDLYWMGSVNADWEKTTLNWSTGQQAQAFTDDTKVYFGNTGVNNISVSEQVNVGAMVVNADDHYVFQGAGKIGGVGSVNKTGPGKLSMLTDNNYTGATVLYNGVLEVNKLANGGQASSIGASQNYNFNLVFKGGLLNYTGASASTDRMAALEGNAGIGVGISATTLTMTGVIDGSGGLTKSGAGTLLFKGINTYEGATTVSEGTLELNGVNVITAGFAAGKSYLLNGGKLKTTGGSTTVYENYYGNIHVEDETTSTFEPFRNCYMYTKFSGGGNLNFDVTYVREYIQGDWSQFSGTVFARGIGTTSDGNQFMLNNTEGIPNGRIVTSGNTKIVCWKNGSTMYLGGLSGPSGTFLAGADKQNNAATMTWIVGGASTDETFNGIINNECSNKSYNGTTNIVKDGSGYWRLGGNNIYKGTTQVKGGTLIVNGTQTGTGKVTVHDEAILAGKGRMPGAVEVLSGATIQPGDPAASSMHIGTFTVGSLTLSNGSVSNMELNRSGFQSDRVASTGAVVLAGRLNLAIYGSLQAGDQFTLFTGSSITGSFAEIIPQTPGENLEWSMNNGVLSVVAAVNAIKTIDDKRVSIYPNPVRGYAEVQLDKQYNLIQVSVVDSNGRKLYANTLENQDKMKIDLSQMSKGVYFVKVNGDKDLKAVKQIIVE